MRISKLWSTVCAAAFLTGFLTVRAQDNPAQAAARAALLGKLNEANSQPAPPANQRMAPAIIVTPTGATVAEPVPLASQKPVMATPPPIETQFSPTSPATLLAPAGTNDTPAQAAARAALTGKMSEPNTPQNQPVNPTPPASVVMTPVNKPLSKSEKAAAAAKAKQEADQAAADLKAKKDADKKVAEQKAADEATAKAQAKAKAKADAQQAAAELKAKKDAEAAAKKQAGAQTMAPPSGVAAAPPAKPAAPEVAPAVKPPPPANANYAGKTLGLKPIVAPSPPVSPQQEEALQALLAKYMANQISPDEYQKERAAILAGH